MVEPDEENLNPPAFVLTDYGAASASLTPRRDTNRAVAKQRRMVGPAGLEPATRPL